MQDNLTWLAYFKKINPSEVSEKVDLAENRRGVVKRALTLIDPELLEFRNDKKDKFQKITAVNDAENFSIFNLISHGGRVLVVLPRLEKGDKNPHAALNYVITGDPKIGSDKNIGGFNNDAAKRQDKGAFHRLISTHGTKIGKDGEIEEEKVSPLNPKIVVDVIRQRHIGVTLALGDTEQSGPEDGSHGHMYIHYTPPTETEEGSIMLGFETADPGATSVSGRKHDMSGKSGDTSLTRGHKFRDRIFGGSLIQPTKFNGLRVKLDRAHLKKIIMREEKEINPENFSLPIRGVSADEISSDQKTASETSKLSSFIGRISSYISQLNEKKETESAIAPQKLKKCVDVIADLLEKTDENSLRDRKTS